MTTPLVAAAFDATGASLALAVVALDVHRVRVQPVNPSPLSKVQLYALDHGVQVSSLAWTGPVGAEDQLVAVGTLSGVVQLFLATQGAVVAQLELVHGAAITGFVHTGTTAWLVDAEGNVTEWDMVQFVPRRQFSFTQDKAVRVVLVVEYNNTPHLLLASHSIYLVDPSSPLEAVVTFPGHVLPVHTLLPLAGHPALFATSAHTDRFVNVYSLEHPKQLPRVLVAPQNVASVLFVHEHLTGHLALSAVTTAGALEVFIDPVGSYSEVVSANGLARLKRKKNAPTRLPLATVVLHRPLQPDQSLPVTVACGVGALVVVLWLEDASTPYFASVPWNTQGKGFAPIEGQVAVERAKPDLRSAVLATNGHDVAAPRRFDDNRAVVQAGDAYGDIEGSDEELLALRVLRLAAEETKQAATKPAKRRLAQTGTLTVVLLQALRSNDHTLLESVLGTRDEETIRKTVARLELQLCVALLNRLAERIAKQLSRQGVLNVWVKWVMVLHGGYLVLLPNLQQTLAQLYLTLKRRLETLPRLMELHSRLAMVETQVEYKRAVYAGTGVELVEADEGVVEYDEEVDDAEWAHLIDVGEEDWSESESEEEDDHDIDIDTGDEDSLDGEADDDTNVQSLLDLEAGESDEE